MKGQHHVGTESPVLHPVVGFRLDILLEFELDQRRGEGERDTNIKIPKDEDRKNGTGLGD